MAWVLVLDPPRGDAARRVGGLPLGLRLALDAQAGGASAIALAPGSQGVEKLLADRRLATPLVERPPAGARQVRVPASYLVHRQLFREIARADDARENPPAERDLASETFPLELPFSFDPIDVVDRRSARRAERLLFRSLRKPQDGWTSRWLNRYVSLALSRLLVQTPFSPNQVSVGILAVGVLGGILAAQGSYSSMLAGAFLFQLQSILDGCDGEMSRVTYRGSLLGEWLDTIGDDITNYGFFAGAALGLWRASGAELYLAAGAVTVAAGVCASAIEYRYLAKIGSGDLLKYPIGASPSPGGAFAAIQPLFKRDTFVFLTLVAAAVGLLGPILVLFALAGIGILTQVVRAELRMKREARQAPAQREQST